jgi:hypothetical protein
MRLLGMNGGAAGVGARPRGDVRRLRLEARGRARASVLTSRSGATARADDNRLYASLEAPPSYRSMEPKPPNKSLFATVTCAKGIALFASWA